MWILNTGDSGCDPNSTGFFLVMGAAYVTRTLPPKISIATLMKTRQRIGVYNMNTTVWCLLGNGGMDYGDYY